MINKEKIRLAVIEELNRQQSVLIKAVEAATSATTHEDAKSEGKYDTRAIESGYLAGAQAARLNELTSKIDWIKKVKFTPFSEDDMIASTALVYTTRNGANKKYFVLALIGGISVTVDGEEIHILTPESKLGSYLVGDYQGSEFELEDITITIDEVS